MSKFFNRAIIGNNNLVASLSEKGELIRVCYPQVDGRQFVDFFKVGVKINDSNLVYFSDNIENKYSQEYIKDTNVLVTTIKNTYYKFNITQTDCVMLDDNVIIKKYIFKNENTITMDTKFIINSKVLSDNIERFGSKAIENGVVQYNQNYSFSILSDNKLSSHKLNDVNGNIESGDISDKDYIGMSNEIACVYNLGTINPGEEKEICIFIHVNKASIEEIYTPKIKMKKIDNEIDKICKYWKKYVSQHNNLQIEKNNKFKEKIYEIYNRTILLFPLLTNKDTGGMVASVEVDENREKSGSYAYCWTRDSVFIAKALMLLGMNKEVELFYNNFCKNTQLENGMWEQRYYTDLSVAPCWGYQIDETASVVYGIWDYYKNTKEKDFLHNNLRMCESAIKFLFKYVENLLKIEEVDIVKKEMDNKNGSKYDVSKHVSYDIWEMNEGIHLYSLASIISAFKCMKKIYEAVDEGEDDPFRLKTEKRNKIVKKLDKYIELLNNYIKENLVDSKKMILKRNTSDELTDICVIGAVYPFEVFEAEDKIVKNTIEKINMTLKTHTNGYLRFEQDSYMGGNNPWVITTLWMALYYIKIGNYKEAKKCFKFVVDTACEHGFLSEQVSNDDHDFKWVIGLGWSHAMFIIVLNELKDIL